MLVQILTDRLIPGVYLLQRPLVDRGDTEGFRQKLRVRMRFRYLKLCFHLHPVFVEFISHVDQLTGTRAVQAAFLCLCHEVRDEAVNVLGLDGNSAFNREDALLRCVHDNDVIVPIHGYALLKMGDIPFHAGERLRQAGRLLFYALVLKQNLDI